MFNEKFNAVTKIFTVLELNWGVLSNARAFAKRRNYHALSLRLSGDAVITHKGNTLNVNKNDILFIPKNTSYHLTTKKNEQLICIHFDMPLLSSLPDVFSPTDPSVFIQLFNEIKEVWQKKSLGYQYKVYEIFNGIIYNIISQQSNLVNSSSNNSKALVFKVVEYIKSNFTLPDLKVSDIASNFFISETYLRRLFKKYLNYTPIEYIIKLRLKYATELLRADYYTVEQVAEKCGITDTKYFSTLYKKRYGVSPSKIND